ncbi:hypothetical protein M9434_002263 [Picochlorum sp. BPE23]|nr:hypothetical protein M9434_002263 [Picochlorum sp. BPE23]
MRVGFMSSMNTRGRADGALILPSRGVVVVEGETTAVRGRGQGLMRSREAGVCWAKKNVKQQKEVSYGRDWYQQTRDAMNTKRSAREEMEIRREANRKANNGRDREDLYTDNWDGDVYKGNRVNILSVLVAISVLAPLIGIIFALNTYGTLWG